MRRKSRFVTFGALIRAIRVIRGLVLMDSAIYFARRYVRNLYSCFAATLVPSESLARVLRHWDVGNVQVVSLGVNVDIFNPAPNDAAGTRETLGVAPHQKLLLYVGRL